jgi:hypothetical protein
VGAFVYTTVCSKIRYPCTRSAALIVGLAVFSHWILNLVAHPRDLAIYDNTLKVGFGLRNYRDPEFALEIALLGIGVVFYLAQNITPTIRKGATIAFVFGLTIIQIGDTYVPRHALSDKATAMGVWVSIPSLSLSLSS